MIIHKLQSNVIVPERQTEWSACFDVHAQLRGPVISEDKAPNFKKVTIIDRTNTKHEVSPEVTWENDTPHTKIIIPPNSRALIPTGMVFDIEPEYSVRMHPRSGLAWNYGVTMVNCEGVIDADYREEVFVPLFNTTEVPYEIEHGDRIAQFEIIRYYDTVTYLSSTTDKAENKTDRVGGFGSTGV